MLITLLCALCDGCWCEGVTYLYCVTACVMQVHFPFKSSSFSVNITIYLDTYVSLVVTFSEELHAVVRDIDLKTLPRIFRSVGNFRIPRSRTIGIHPFYWSCGGKNKNSNYQGY